MFNMLNSKYMLAASILTYINRIGSFEIFIPHRNSSSPIATFRSPVH